MAEHRQLRSPEQFLLLNRVAEQVAQFCHAVGVHIDLARRYVRFLLVPCHVCPLYKA